MVEAMAEAVLQPLEARNCRGHHPCRDGRGSAGPGATAGAIF